MSDRTCIKSIFLISNASIIVYKAGKRTVVENNKFIHFNLSVGTYSIHDFNTKIRAAILQEKQNWEPPQINNLKLVIPEHYTLMADNTIFIALGIQITILKRLHKPDNYLEETIQIR